MKLKIFQEILTTLEQYVSFQTLLSVNYGYTTSDDNIGIKMIDSLIKALYGSFSEEAAASGLIEFFCWECEFGNTPRKFTLNDQEVLITTAEQVWDLLNLI